MSINRDYLLNPYNQSKLSKLINKTLKEFFIEFIFCDEENKAKIYRHNVLLSYNKIESKYKIFEENFDILKGRTLNSPELENIFSVKDNQLIFNKEMGDYWTKYYKDCINQSNGNALVNSFFVKGFLELPSKIKEKNQNFLEDMLKGQDMMDLFFLPAYSSTYLLNDDKHEPKTFNKEAIEKLIASIKESNKPIKTDDLLSFETNDEFEEIIKRDSLASYEAQNEKLQSFIKIFKPELKKIALDKKVNGNLIHCRRIFDYGDKLQIDVEYESSGIKHLIMLHKYLQSYISGYTVFIDEIDVNINSVFLCKLIDFLSTVGKGQLCFTSHNLDSMNSMKNMKASICAIGYNGNVDVWTKNGNKSPAKEYIKGEFEHSPFNVESFDFYSCFDVSENK